MGLDLPGVHRALNIQEAPDVYEIENLAADPEQRIEAAMRAIAPWDGRIMLDLGAGTGFHLPRWHATAAHVFAVEPHDASRLHAMARVVALGLERTSVLTGSAERILLPDASVDVVHARFAYFFGPGCEPGLAEVGRVIRPGGAAFVIDNDLRHGTFADWLHRVPFFATIDPDARDAFWSAQGFTLTTIPSLWRFERRTDLEAVVCNEFAPALAEALIAEHAGLEVEYWYSLYHRQYP